MLAEDLETLRLIVDGLRRLETKALDTLKVVDACTRGYFTPPEEDSVMRIVFTFRSYRLGLYEIIQHYLDYDPTAGIRSPPVKHTPGMTLRAEELQQFLDASHGLRWQSREHVDQIGVRVVPVELR